MKLVTYFVKHRSDTEASCCRWKFNLVIKWNNTWVTFPVLSL